MVTTKNVDVRITTIIDIIGLSSEVKPIVSHEKYLISSGSTYTETDTGDMYMYYQKTRRWYLLQD